MRLEDAEVRRWLEKARHDWMVVQRILKDGGPELDVAAFHCQQAVEKVLKAYLISQRRSFEKIHDLRRLLDYCVEREAAFESLRDDVEPLTIYAVAFRYPGPSDPMIEEVIRAERVVAKAWQFIADRLPPHVVPE